MPPNTETTTDQLSQLSERIAGATNVLITVSDSPSVDQLAACIGLTLALNKHGKHATAVFSGTVPSTLEFLQPEHTLETNTDSLRDFIISLDKSKADKLRYKVEDDFVKIFITPYRTSIGQDDLNFSQGDFNIDLIITIGVQERSHLDAAIIAHGRILHDAVVASLTNDTASELGTINWVDTNASSLGEMVSDLIMKVDKNLIDSQIATALLTGLVAETNRFGNDKARPHTMSVAGMLMAAGASPQLISNKLEEPEPAPEPEPEVPDVEIPELAEEAPVVPPAPEPPAEVEPPVPAPEPAPAPQPEPTPSTNDGSIQIEHSQDKAFNDDIHIDDEGKLQAIKDLEEAQARLEAEAQKAATPAPEPPAEVEQPAPEPTESTVPQKSLVLDPPQLTGQLTANTVTEQYSPSTDPLGLPSPAPLLERTELPTMGQTINPPEMPQSQTLSDLEQAVGSPHVEAAANDGQFVPPPPPVDDARAVVENAIESSDVYRPQPDLALGASPVDLNLGHNPTDVPAQTEEQNNASTTPPAPPVPPPFVP